MTSKTKSANINIRLYPDIKQEAENIFAFDLRGARWQDPVSLAALEESKQMETNPGEYKSYRNADELFADLDLVRLASHSKLDF